jgi:hypothetical protein
MLIVLPNQSGENIWRNAAYNVLSVGAPDIDGKIESHSYSTLEPSNQGRE